MPLPILEIVLPRGEKKRLSDFAAELTSHVDSDGNIFGVTIDCSAGECTLIFDGPMLLGSDIIGSNTSLVFQYLGHTFDKCINLMGDVGILSSCNFYGSFYCDCLYPELFGAKGDGVTDDREALQTCLDAAVDSGIFRVRMQPRTYLITDTLYYRGNLQLEGSYFTDNYHSEGSCILANLVEGVTEHYDQDNNVCAYHRNELKFALETDCKYKVNNNVVGRIPVIRSLTDGEVLVYNKGVEDGQANYDTVISVPPIHIRNIAFKSTNNTFGAIRAFGLINSKIEGISIHGFRVGLYIYKGWEFDVSRLHIRTGMAGLVAKDITCGLFNSVQFLLNKSSAPTYNEHHQPCNLDFADAPNLNHEPGESETILNPYHEFMENRVMGLAHYKQVYNHDTVYENGDITNENEWIKTVAIYGSSLNATFNSCSMEGFDIGCIGYSLDCVFNLPYVESIKKTIAYVHKGHIEFNNMVGAQSLTKDYTYVAPEIVSKIVLNGCHPGTFYPTYSYATGLSESYNRNKYNYKSYVVKNHNKISKALPYASTTYLDYDVGDTVFVKQFTLDDFEDLHEDPNNPNLVTKTKEQQLEEAEASLANNWGDYQSHPLSLELALQRIANDFNYRHVGIIVLHTSVEVYDTHTWRSQTGRLIIKRLSTNYSLAMKAKQYFECDVVFNNFAIDLYSSLCFALNKQAQEIRIENTQVRFHRNDIWIIDNTGTLPTGKSLSRSITLYVGTLPNVPKYFENNWPSLSTIIAERAGISLGAGSYTSLPSQYLVDDYEFDEVNVDPQTGQSYVVHHIWDAQNNIWISQNLHPTPFE